MSLIIVSCNFRKDKRKWVRNGSGTGQVVQRGILQGKCRCSKLVWELCPLLATLCFVEIHCFWPRCLFIYCLSQVMSASYHSLASQVEVCNSWTHLIAKRLKLMPRVYSAAPCVQGQVELFLVDLYLHKIEWKYFERQINKTQHTICIMHIYCTVTSCQGQCQTPKVTWRYFTPLLALPTGRFPPCQDDVLGAQLATFKWGQGNICQRSCDFISFLFVSLQHGVRFDHFLVFTTAEHTV